ncbi:MAG: trypsin-like serine protease [Bdellovibrionota bacterium]
MKFSLLAIVALQALSAFAMINGTPVDKSYEAIGSIRTYDMANGSSCTATLIAPDWIVTAEHCVWGGSEENPEQLKPSQMFFQLGPDSHKPIKSVKLRKWISAPEGLDVSFAQLAQPITNVTPIPVSLDLSRFRDTSKVYEVVGYGYQGVSGYGSKSGFKGMAKYKVTSMNANPLLSIFKSKNNFQSFLDKAFQGEEADMLLGDETLIPGYQVHAWDDTGRMKGILTKKPAKGWSNTCNGDSGGPMIETTPAGKKVVGIISGGFTGMTMGCVPVGSKISIFGTSVQNEFKKTGIKP